MVCLYLQCRPQTWAFFSMAAVAVACPWTLDGEVRQEGDGTSTYELLQRCNKSVTLQKGSKGGIVWESVYHGLSMFIPNPMLYHHVVIIFSIKMSVKSPKAEPTCSCVSAAASAESCGSLVIIATCSPKTPSPVRMDQHPPETMVDVGDWGGVLTKLRDGTTWHHLHWAIINGLV